MSETVLGPIGKCPVQAYGIVDGHWWYFRARHESWSFQVSSAPFDVHTRFGYADVSLTDTWWNAIVWEHERDYEPIDGGEREHAAGWMSDDEAARFIREAIGMYRANARPN